MERKTFHNSSRWVTIASSDRTRRWTCLLRVTAQAREEDKTPQQKQAPPDMQTGQSIRAFLRQGVPADHEAHSQPQRRQLRRVATTELRRDCSPEAEAGESQTTARRSDGSCQNECRQSGTSEARLHPYSGWPPEQDDECRRVTIASTLR